MRLDAPEQPKTLSVPEAGRRYFNLSRNSSYEAAARGNYRRSVLAVSCEFPWSLWSGCSTDLSTLILGSAISAG